jgi:hypothetical protein
MSSKESVLQEPVDYSTMSDEELMERAIALGLDGRIR